MDQPWENLPEVNYDAGRPTASFKPTTIKHVNYANMPRIRGVIAMAIIRYALRSQAHFLNAQRYHKVTLSQLPQLSSADLVRDELELMVYCIRKSLDHLAQGLFIKLYAEVVNKKGSIQIDSIGGALKSKNDHRWPEFTEVFFNGPLGHTEHFLITMNEIANGYKHSYFMPESAMVFSRDAACIVLLDIPNKNIHATPRVLNHNATHLFMGYQDVFDRLLVGAGATPLFDPAENEPI